MPPSQTGVERPHQKSPPWLPISLLAVSTVLLTMPLVLLRRHKKNIRAEALKSAGAPPRRMGSGLSLVPGTARLTVPLQGVRMDLRKPTLDPEQSRGEKDGGQGHFNSALYTGKAFSLATLLVGVSTVSTVWAVKTWLGVHNMQEFADRMRIVVSTNMPILSSRIHRPMEEVLDGNPGVRLDPAVPSLEFQESSGWNWSDAETRLRVAFDRGGFSEWARAAWKEVEDEASAERANRGRH